jgi:hypothetical protein
MGFRNAVTSLDILGQPVPGASSAEILRAVQSHRFDPHAFHTFNIVSYNHSDRSMCTCTSISHSI